MTQHAGVKRVLAVGGTRPEIIKLAPVVHALRAAGVETPFCATAQHRELADEMLRFFDIVPDHDLAVMTPGQDLFDVTTKVLLGMRGVLDDVRPDCVIVQGDTTTVMAAALAAFYREVPVAHVEAGLRTWNLRNPFPEELNRWIADAASTWHFAPTEGAREALLRCGIGESTIHVTGNTVIDALQWTLARLGDEPPAALTLPEGARVVLLTMHRRESFGAPMRAALGAVRALTERYEDVHAVFPAHPNPHVAEAVRDCLEGAERVHAIAPQPYPEFVKWMRDAAIILTDSGGVQEEAPTLGKPTLVLRETSERPEGIAAGTAKLVGTDAETILREVSRLLDDPAAYAAMAAPANPYGDGHAAERIAAILAGSART